MLAVWYSVCLVFGPSELPRQRSCGRLGAAIDCRLRSWYPRWDIRRNQRRGVGGNHRRGIGGHIGGVIGKHLAICLTHHLNRYGQKERFGELHGQGLQGKFEVREAATKNLWRLWASPLTKPSQPQQDKNREM